MKSNLTNGSAYRKGNVMSQGAELSESGVRYRTWCKHDRVSVAVVDESDTVRRRLDLQPEGGGYFSALDEQGAPGDLYWYHFGESAGWPDPASRWQPRDVHGPSMVIDSRSFGWSDESWRPPARTELVIYELHVGSFTPEGTFRAAISKLPHLVALGVTAIELMPIAEFPGERNWGYDGVAPYAPSRTYGHPDDLRSLVDAAHAHGLAVVLDVVYNHLGPDGNYLGVFHGDYFNPAQKTPWGVGLNFSQAAVREFFAGNPIYWMREFHIDGFRLDATHAIIDSSERHILAEISERVHAEGGFVIAEDERNDPAMLRPVAERGMGFDGCWSDDFHHVLHVALTGQREGYYENFTGTPRELIETLHHGWLYRGQRQSRGGQPRGGDPAGLSAEQFVFCISNHDQTGNRAFGERLSHLIDPAAYRAVSAILCLVPQTPMLFMGQEWAASTPFQFFTDHNANLGKLVTAGRRHEFRHFAAFRDPGLLESIPDPQADETFARSKLRWDESSASPHVETLRLYQDFLALRRTHPAFRNCAHENWSVTELENGIVALLLKTPGEDAILALMDLPGGCGSAEVHAKKFGAEQGYDWQTLLSSNSPRYGGSGQADSAEPATTVFTAGPFARTSQI